jgi:hypothetical protein
MTARACVTTREPFGMPNATHYARRLGPRSTAVRQDARRGTERPNKELKLTKPCAIGASQLNSSVGPTWSRVERARLADVEVKSSRIEGLGVFAARPFRTGERIRRVNVVREITPESPIREDLGERVNHCSYPDGRIVLFGFPDRHVNHSCDPNAWERGCPTVC